MFCFVIFVCLFFSNWTIKPNYTKYRCHGGRYLFPKHVIRVVYVIIDIS